MKFNTHANKRECRPCQRATATTVQTTNNKTKQTLKYLLIAFCFCFFISVGGLKDVTVFIYFANFVAAGCSLKHLSPLWFFIKMHGCSNQLPLAINFFKHFYFIGISFYTFLRGRYFIMTHPCIIPVYTIL